MPFNKLPREVCHDIFLLCVRASFLKHREDADKKQPYTLSDHPTRFTSVCKDWAEVARSSPELWASINVFVVTKEVRVDDIDRPGVELLPPLPIVQKSIDLSRALPLSFSVIPWNEIKDDNPHINAYVRYVKQMLDNVFVPHHTRWRSATFQEWPSLYELPFTWSITPNFPRLQQFSFTNSSSGAADPEDPFAQGVIHVLKNAPVLRHLDVQLYGTDEHFDNWTPEDTCHRIATAIPWERLTALSLFMGYMSVPKPQAFYWAVPKPRVPHSAYS
ncbi:hypothetical protein DFP72DRAFT_1045235 [Ephemerocybe angulata]|uniref:F-box domain-containing protein n=1 Tax=Ephemerocybe angulata TaxID=980116 RepID=A0A8H6HZE1_9AGAR|nr:hypothetical protein DFP72DRAFT_1045235 [Tulosesus angulatus]